MNEGMQNKTQTKNNHQKGTKSTNGSSKKGLRGSPYKVKAQNYLRAQAGTPKFRVRSSESQLPEPLAWRGSARRPQSWPPPERDEL